MAVRTRFAPSPTGYLHIGGARTALFSWLFARHHGGTFVLRIEDTDRERSTEESIQAIVDGLTWLGIDWDEGPFRQTDRYAVYQAQAERLLAAGTAYRCWCTAEELEARRAAQLAAGARPAYDRSCRDRTSAPPGRTAFAVRFRTPADAEVAIDDLVKGRVVFRTADLDDFIIQRSDGSPVYNFSVVVDDVDMAITHVIRGDDHLANTPRQVLLYQALGAALPHFAHVPLILGPDRTRLSKRHGATSVMAYREQGYLPEAMVNFLARLGWAHGDQEIFSREELIRYFTLEQVGASPAVFNPEKLLWTNFQWLKVMPPERLAELVVPFLERACLPIPEDRQWFARAVGTLQERAKTLVELAEFLRFYVTESVDIQPKAAAQHLTPGILPVLAELTERLQQLPVWSAATIQQAFQDLLHAHDLALGKLAQPVRVAVTGGTVSPGIFEVLDILGRERTIRRLQAAMTAAAARSRPAP